MRLLGCRWGSGAGVLRAVLERRGRSVAAVASSRSTLAALLRDEVGRLAGRVSGAVAVGVGVETGGGIGKGTVTGAAGVAGVVAATPR